MRVIALALAAASLLAACAGAGGSATSARSELDAVELTARCGRGLLDRLPRAGARPLPGRRRRPGRPARRGVPHQGLRDRRPGRLRRAGGALRGRAGAPPERRARRRPVPPRVRAGLRARLLQHGRADRRGGGRRRAAARGGGGRSGEPDHALLQDGLRRRLGRGLPQPRRRARRGKHVERDLAAAARHTGARATWASRSPATGSPSWWPRSPRSCRTSPPRSWRAARARAACGPPATRRGSRRPRAPRAPADRLVVVRESFALGFPGSGGFHPAELSKARGRPRRASLDGGDAPDRVGEAGDAAVVRTRLGFDVEPRAADEADPAVELLLALRRQQLGQCYEQARTDAAIRTELFLVFAVDADGRPARVRAAAEPTDPLLEACGIDLVAERGSSRCRRRGSPAPSSSATPSRRRRRARRRPSPRAASCVPSRGRRAASRRSWPVPPEYRGTVGSLTVKFAVDGSGAPVLFHPLTPAPDSVVAAVGEAIRRCEWSPGADANGRKRAALAHAAPSRSRRDSGATRRPKTGGAPCPALGIDRYRSVRGGAGVGAAAVVQEVTWEEALRAGRVLFGTRADELLAGASWRDELKRAYKRRVLETHPDRALTLGSAETELAHEFQAVADAYRLLQEAPDAAAGCAPGSRLRQPGGRRRRAAPRPRRPGRAPRGGGTARRARAAGRAGGEGREAEQRARAGRRAEQARRDEEQARRAEAVRGARPRRGRAEAGRAQREARARAGWTAEPAPDWRDVVKPRPLPSPPGPARRVPLLQRPDLLGGHGRGASPGSAGSARPSGGSPWSSAS